MGFRSLKLWTNSKIFFSIIFLFTWAGGIWLVPFGPTLRGVHFLPFFAASLFGALLLSVSISSFYLTHPKKKGRQIKMIQVESALDAFFWTLFVFLIVVVIARYTLLA